MFVWVEQAALARILTHLIGNAIKFTEHGSVTVTTTPAGEAFEVAVADTGVGISEAFRPHLFEEFQQESAGLNRRYEGVGLGLTITRRLLDIMGGTIAVESASGQGSTFRVRLPMGAPPSAQRGAPEARAGRVFIVEDDEGTRLLLRTLLHHTYDLVLTESVDEALVAAEAPIPFDVVLLDINLGDGPTGLQLLPRLRAGHALSGARFLALTAYAPPDDACHYLDAGFDGCVAKPFTKRALLKALAEAA